MTTQRELASQAHEADTRTTVARLRLYDAEASGGQMLGFNCRAEDFLNVDMVGDYLRSYGRQSDGTETPLYEVSELQRLNSADKPFVTAAYEVHPPLDPETQHNLGQLLVEGTFLRDSARMPEGIMLIDNTGNQQPDHPLDRGRQVIAQTPVRR